MGNDMTDIEQLRSLYPRVSDIIRKQNDQEFRNIPLETLANACIRGKKVHDYCTAWINNLWVSDVEPEYEPYVNSFIEWAGANIEECLYSSIRLYDDEKKFTGEFDMIVKMKGSNNFTLIDIKTSVSSSKVWPIQLAAYDHLCRLNEYHVDQVMNVHLKKTKAALYEVKEGEKLMISPPQVITKVLEHHDLTSYWQIFSSCLECYRYFESKEIK